MTTKRIARCRERGQSIIETALLAPWIFILFMGIVDFGFYGYALIATENAARVAALYTAQGAAADQAGACIHAANELRMLPNFTSFQPGCPVNSPLFVDAAEVPPASSPDGEEGTRVTVTYQSIPLFPIPGLTGLLNITRIVEMRVED